MANMAGTELARCADGGYNESDRSHDQKTVGCQVTQGHEKFFSFILRDEKSLESFEQKCNMILCFLKGYSWLRVEESVGKQAQKQGDQLGSYYSREDCSIPGGNW